MSTTDVTGKITTPAGTVPSPLTVTVALVTQENEGRGAGVTDASLVVLGAAVVTVEADGTFSVSLTPNVEITSPAGTYYVLTVLTNVGVARRHFTVPVSATAVQIDDHLILTPTPPEFVPLVGPEGPAGPQGPQGPEGPAGTSGGTAATTVTSETTHGLAPVVGTDTAFARGGHRHGTPENPVPAHEAAADPHPSYLTPTEGNAVYEPSGSTAAHAGAVDPHAGYRLESAPITAADVAADVATQQELDDHGHAVQRTTVTTAAYTAALTDANKVLRTAFVGASTLTIPADATVAFPLDTVISPYAAGGALTIAPDTGVVIRNNGTALAQYAECSLRKDGTDEWVRVG